MSAYLFQNLYNVLAIRSAHPKRRYVSWVKNDVNQFGLYLSRYLWIETGCLAQYARTSHLHEMSGTTIMAPDIGSLLDRRQSVSILLLGFHLHKKMGKKMGKAKPLHLPLVFVYSLLLPFSLFPRSLYSLARIPSWLSIYLFPASFISIPSLLSNLASSPSL